MHILLTNDDGVHAPGLKALYVALSQVAQVTVIAPDRDRSAASKSLTLTAPLRVKILENGFYSVDGTPTDCVHLAITSDLIEPPDMIVSGINAGSNLGDDVIYSGTVAAATEGQFLRFPSLAISLDGPPFEHYACAAQVARQLIENLIKNPLGPDVILNINVPNLAFEELQGYQVARLGRRHCSTGMIEQIDPRGHKVYWVGIPGPRHEAGPDTDFFALSQGFVAITPLEIDLTRYSKLKTVKSWAEDL